jgi:hypothetical protein
LIDAQQTAITLDGRHLEMPHCTDAQARGIGGHHQSAVLGVFGAAKETLEFGRAQDLREL